MTGDDIVGLIIAVRSPPTWSTPSSPRRSSDDAANWLELVLSSPPRRHSPRCSAATWPRSTAAARPRGDRVFGAVERPIYRLCGIDPEASSAGPSTPSRCWPSAWCRCWSSTPSCACRATCRSTPTTTRASRPALSFNTAVSFLTNTNWQNYAGESTMSHLTQMAGLACTTSSRPRPARRWPSRSSGASSAAGRGTLGNFWVDLVRTCVRVLLPLAFVVALVLVSQGVIQNFHADHDRHHRRRARRSRSPAARSPARRRSRRSARTAAASSTPTRPTRSRTPTGSPTCSRSG